MHKTNIAMVGVLGREYAGSEPENRSVPPFRETTGHIKSNLLCYRFLVF